MVGWRSRRGRAVRELLWVCFAAYLSQTHGETFIDSCDVVHGQQGRLGGLVVRSHNVVVDATNPQTFLGDAGRFKRENSDPGYLSYESKRGFEELVVVGYAYEELPMGSWSLDVTTGATPSANQIPEYNLTDIRMAQYVEQSATESWRGFEIRLPLRQSCPRSVVVHLRGAATNNEFPGWGLQIAEVRLVETWYAFCEVDCETDGPVCSDRVFRDEVVSGEDFSNVYAVENIQIEGADAEAFRDDSGRLERVTNETGELVLVSSGGIRSLELEIFHHSPFDAVLTLLPYVHESCRGIELTPVLEPRTRPNHEGWIFRSARVDLANLPYCPTRVALRIDGGSNGWEIQISRVTVTLATTLGRDSTSFSELRLLTQTDNSDDSLISQWWLWLAIFVGLTIVLLCLAAAIQWTGLVFGDDTRIKYHISNWPLFRRRHQETTTVAAV